VDGLGSTNGGTMPIDYTAKPDDGSNTVYTYTTDGAQEIKVEFYVSDEEEKNAVRFLESRNYRIYKQHGGRAVVNDAITTNSTTVTEIRKALE
jgi:hypothetical protein